MTRRLAEIHSHSSKALWTLDVVHKGGKSCPCSLEPDSIDSMGNSCWLLNLHIRDAKKIYRGSGRYASWPRKRFLDYLVWHRSGRALLKVGDCIFGHWSWLLHVIQSSCLKLVKQLLPDQKILMSLSESYWQGSSTWCSIKKTHSKMLIYKVSSWNEEASWDWLCWILGNHVLQNSMNAFYFCLWFSQQ